MRARAHLLAVVLLLAASALLPHGCTYRKKAPSPRLESARSEGPSVAEVPQIEKPAAPSTGATAPGPARALDGRWGSALSDVAEAAVKGVVNVSSTKIVRSEGPSPYHGNPFFEYFFRQRPPDEPAPERRARSLGSGVIVSDKGIILTNNHVVSQSQDIRVTLSDGRELAAEIVGTDPKSDLAVLRLKSPPKDLRPLVLGDSSTLRLGEIVLAIGDPFGVGQTVTMGIVSAVGRANMGIVDYEDFIQTDAAINPGNSGGALVNLKGQLVGINTAILSRSGGYQGIGFSIPTKMAQPIMESLVRFGRVVRGWLGVVIQPLGREMADAMKIPEAHGVLVSDVQAGSPAAKADVRRGDVILKIDGEQMDSVSRLRNRVATMGVKKKVTLSLLRAGRPLEVPVTLEELPGEGTAKLDASQGALGGLTIEGLTLDAARRLGLPRGVAGVVVTRVDAGSAAEAAGLQVDDVILEVNRQPVGAPGEFARGYQAASGRLLLLVYRRGSSMYMLLEK
jgi:serine protease Do